MTTCYETGKKIFPDQASARAAAEYESQQRALMPIRAYVCEFCGGYHLTHKRKYRTF